MNINSTFHVSVFLMVVLVFSMPFITTAQQNPEVADTKSAPGAYTQSEKEALMATAKADAERDVKVDFGNYEKLLWFSAGFGCSVFGIVAAYLEKAQTPPVRLLGKSPDYVEIYAHTYQDKLQRERIIFAGTGCILSLGLLVALTSNTTSDNASDIASNDSLGGASDNTSLEDSVSGCLSLLDLLDLGCLCLMDTDFSGCLW